jgi:hypothetical protein
LVYLKKSKPFKSFGLSRFLATTTFKTGIDGMLNDLYFCIRVLIVTEDTATGTVMIHLLGSRRVFQVR